MDETNITQPSDEQYDRLVVLLDKLADQNLCESEFHELEQLLSQSESLRLLFAERMSLEVGIAGWRNANDPAELLDALVGLPSTPSFDAGTESVTLRKSSPRPFVSGTVSRPWAYGLVAAVCLAIVATLKGWWNFEEPGVPRIASMGGKAQGTDSTSSTSLSSKVTEADSQDVYIGRVRALSDNAAWKSGDFLNDFLLRIESGEQLGLAKGLAEIELKSGTTLTLHGDTSYTFTSGDHGVLNHGTISTHTNRGGYTTKFGRMEVRSLGEEAYYAIVSNGTNKVAVSQGEVSVIHAKRRRTTAPALLGAGRVVYVDSAGNLTGASDGPDRIARQQAIATNSYRPPQGVLSLVDIVSGGNGLGANLAGIVDAASGSFAWRTMQDEPLLRLPEGQFRRGQGSRLIDGTFVASGEKGQLQVSSAGHTTVGVQSHGGSRGIIWARRQLPLGKGKQTRLANMDEAEFAAVNKRLKGARDGVVGISANSGITFDLTKAGEAQGSPIRAFQTQVRAVTPKSLSSSLQLLVIVDGEVRNSTSLTGHNEKDEKVRVSLEPDDRYLTLFVAGEGDTEALGQMVLFDPMLDQRATQQKP